MCVLLRVAFTALITALAACQRHEVITMDDETFFSQTERGRFAVSLPSAEASSAPERDDREASLDQVFAAAKSEVAHYSDLPASEWEFVHLAKIRDYRRQSYFVVHLERRESIDHRLVIPVSLRGQVLARPKR